jgi:pimeloyl-ACP methyl ester carboxylesterase
MVAGKGPQPNGAERLLQDLAIQLPAAPTPFGTYVETVQTGNLLFFSGMLPVVDHKPKYVGRLGKELDTEAGRDAAYLFYDYRTNVDAYPKWQAWMKKTQPKLLVLWGKHDLSFDPGEPERYRKDVPTAKVYVLDAGHFALDTKADKIATLVREFMRTQS